MEESAEAASGEEIPQTDNSPSKTKGQTRRAPNRQKFEEDLNEIKQEIESKEQHLQNILGNGKDSPQSRLQQLRDRREAANQRRKNISTQLEALNQQINSKRDATSQLRSKLQYQTEAQVEDVVHRLEAQLQNHSFRLAEERRLVAEIDKLRRSKKSVKQYIEAKEELTTLRDSQQQLRVERDSISRELLSLRGEEDAIHSEIRKNRDVADILKKELDELYERKRSRVTEFKADQSLYAQYREQRRSDLGRQRMHEKLHQVRSQDREPAVAVSIEPYLEERQLCTTLLSFLSKLDSTPSATPVTPVSCSASLATTPMSPDDARSRVPGCFEEGMDTLFAGIPRKNSRKVKRSLSRASMNKKRLVPLTPDLLSQFASLSVTAPTCHAEVPALVETLKAKQKLYSCMAAAELRNNNAAAEMMSDSAVAELRNNNAAAKMMSDNAAVEMMSDSAAVELRNNNAAAEMSSDNAAAELRNNNASAEMSSDSTAVEMSSDSVAAELRNDSTITEMKSESAAAELRNNSAITDMKSDIAAAVESDNVSLELKKETASDHKQLPMSRDVPSSHKSEAETLSLAIPPRNKPPETLNLRLSAQSSVEAAGSVQPQTSLLNGTDDAAK